VTRYRKHLIEFTGDPDRPYEILHDLECEGGDCYHVYAAKHGRVHLSPRPPGRYRCHIDWGSCLQVGHQAVPDRWADPPTIEKPWTMGDLRLWMGKWGHIPDDFPVTAHVPERPRSWARDGSPLYTNALHGLQVDDPKDFE
jgi:hypothetical protein